MSTVSAGAWASVHGTGTLRGDGPPADAPSPPGPRPRGRADRGGMPARPGPGGPGAGRRPARPPQRDPGPGVAQQLPRRARAGAVLRPCVGFLGAAAEGFEYTHRPLAEQLDAGVRADRARRVRRRPRRRPLRRTPCSGRCSASAPSTPRSPAPGPQGLPRAGGRLPLDLHPAHRLPRTGARLVGRPSRPPADHDPDRGQGRHHPRPRASGSSSRCRGPGRLRRARGRDPTRCSPPTRVLTPADVRGRAGQPRATRCATGGWPRLDAGAGQVLFVLDDKGAKRDAYRAQVPDLPTGSSSSTCPEADPDAAIMVVNDPLGDADRIRALVAAGFIVRTRADADTVQARTGDTTSGTRRSPAAPSTCRPTTCCPTTASAPATSSTCPATAPPAATRSTPPGAASRPTSRADPRRAPTSGADLVEGVDRAVEVDRAEAREPGGLGHRRARLSDMPSVPRPAPPGSDSAEDMQLITLVPYMSVAIGFRSTFSANVSYALMSATSQVPSSARARPDRPGDPVRVGHVVQAVERGHEPERSVGGQRPLRGSWNAAFVRPRWPPGSPRPGRGRTARCRTPRSGWPGRRAPAAASPRRTRTRRRRPLRRPSSRSATPSSAGSDRRRGDCASTARSRARHRPRLPARACRSRGRCRCGSSRAGRPSRAMLCGSWWNMPSRFISWVSSTSTGTAAGVSENRSAGPRCRRRSARPRPGCRPTRGPSARRGPRGRPARRW